MRAGCLFIYQLLLRVGGFYALTIGAAVSTLSIINPNSLPHAEMNIGIGITAAVVGLIFSTARITPDWLNLPSTVWHAALAMIAIAGAFLPVGMACLSLSRLVSFDHAMTGLIAGPMLMPVMLGFGLAWTIAPVLGLIKADTHRASSPYQRPRHFVRSKTAASA